MNATLVPAMVKPKRHTFTLSATIDEGTYNVFPVRDIQDPEISKAFTFAKRGVGNGDAVYTVARHADGRIVCECPDYVARHEDHGTLCKHCECTVRMGLLDAPKPAENGKPEPIPPAPQKSASCEANSAPDTLSRLQARAFGLKLPASKPQDSPRTFAEGLLADEPAPAPEPCCGPAEAQPCAQCVEASHAVAPAEDVESETADNIRSTDRLSLAELVEAQARAFRAWNLGAADLMAERLEELAAEVRLTNAATPDQFRDRIDALRMDEDRRLIAHGESIGFDLGLAVADRHD